jgi:hypothetical protein
MLLVGWIAFVASLYVLVTQGLSIRAARRTGVIRGGAAGKASVDRAVEPDRFDDLLEARRKALFLPRLIVASAICVVGLGLAAAAYMMWR